MRSLNNKKIILLFFFLILLLISLFLYPKNLRSQYSNVLNTKAEDILEKNPRRSFLLYSTSNMLEKNDKSKIGIGEIYMDSGLYSEAENIFKSVNNQSSLTKIFSMYLEKGLVDKSTYLLDKLKATDDNLYNMSIYSLFLDKNLPNCNKNLKCNDLKKEVNSILNNKNDSYKKTAIAEFLYKEGYKKIALMKLESKEFDNYRDYYILLGKLYEENSLYKKSAIALNKSIELDPYNYELKELLNNVKSKEVKKEIISQKSLKVKY